MRRINDVKENYNTSNETDRKKTILINWFQKHPEKRFDRMEVHQKLHGELGVGKGRVGQYLKDLEEESVLQSHGEQRKAYRMEDDILIPIKFQAFAGFRQIATIFDFGRWGVVGFSVISTVLWCFLTLPFWFFSVVMLVSPMDSIGPFGESEIYLFTLLMTIWLLIFVIISYILFRIWDIWHSRIKNRQELGSAN